MHRFLHRNEPLMKQLEASPTFQSVPLLLSKLLHSVDGSGAETVNLKRFHSSSGGSSCSLFQFSSYSPGSLRSQTRLYSSDSTDEDLAKEGESPPEKGGTGTSGDETGLPLIQRCKVSVCSGIFVC